MRSGRCPAPLPDAASETQAHLVSVHRRESHPTCSHFALCIPLTKIVCGLNKIKICSPLSLGNNLQCAFQALDVGSTITQTRAVPGTLARMIREAAGCQHGFPASPNRSGSGMPVWSLSSMSYSFPPFSNLLKFSESWLLKVLA